MYLHGWGSNGGIFQPVAEQLPSYANYLVDFVGFGQSDKPPIEGWTVLDYANDVLSFLDEQDLQHVTIVGHSFGCRVAMVLASLHPNRVGKLLLVAPAGLRKPSFRRLCKVARYKIHKFLCEMGLCQNITAHYGSADYNACEDCIKNTFVKVVNQDLSVFAKKIVCPTLIINGNKDTQTPLKHAQNLQKLIKTSSLVEIDGDHFAFFRHPQAFAQTIKLFEES